MIQQFVNKPPSAVIRGRSQTFLEFTSNRFVPGPGKYDVKDVRLRSTWFSFGYPHDKNSKSKIKLHDTPGPGSYKIRDDFGIGAKAVSILGRYEGNSKSKDHLHISPGPGTYNVERFNRTVGPKFSIKGAVSEDPIMREK